MKLKIDMGHYGPKCLGFIHVKLLRGAAALRTCLRRMKLYVPVVSLEFVGFDSHLSKRGIRRISGIKPNASYY